MPKSCKFLVLILAATVLPGSARAEALGPGKAAPFVGMWMTTSDNLAGLVEGWPKGPGWITLTVSGDGSALATIEAGKRTEVLQGTTTVSNRIRVMTLSDIDGKKYSFGLLSYGPNLLGLATPGVPPRMADLDANGDGLLTLEEVAKTSLSVSFFGLDANRDGRLDAREFEASLIKNPPKEQHIRFQRIGRRFSDLDRDKDGLLSNEECEGTTLVGKRFESDVNRDARIDPVEFVGFWAKFPPLK